MTNAILFNRCDPMLAPFLEHQYEELVFILGPSAIILVFSAPPKAAVTSRPLCRIIRICPS